MRYFCPCLICPFFLLIWFRFNLSILLFQAFLNKIYKKNNTIIEKDKKENSVMRKKTKSILIGLVAGFISGLFASGGGLILVPAFIYFMKMEDRKARGTSVFCILPMVIASSLFYYKDNYIDWEIGIKCAIGGIIGGIIGAKLLKKLPIKYIRIVFTIFLIYVSIRMLV